MENYQLLKNKFWMIDILSEFGSHYYVHAIDFSLNYNENEIYFNVLLRPHHSYPNDLDSFYYHVINKNGWKRIEVDHIKYGKSKTKYFEHFLKDISNRLNIPIKEIEISLKVNNVTYSKYKLTDLKSYKYKSIDEYYYDFIFEQI